MHPFWMMDRRTSLTLSTQHDGGNNTKVYDTKTLRVLVLIVPRLTCRILRNGRPAFRTIRNCPTLTPRRSFSLGQFPQVPQITATELLCAKQPEHVGEIAQQLEDGGILKVNLSFDDNDSHYLQHLIGSLNKWHNHRLPIAHSATRGWFWDVRPAKDDFQSGHQARSETMQDFPWHTDCSYEDPPPRYFALQVLQPDRCGGGTLSVLPVDRVLSRLDDSVIAQLMLPDYHINIPAEFMKSPHCSHIQKPLLVRSSRKKFMMRFRADIITPTNATAAQALNALQEQLHDLSLAKSSDAGIHLTADKLVERSVILIDNRRWLHARNKVCDPRRHLRRVRWDAVPFE